MKLFKTKELPQQPVYGLFTLTSDHFLNNSSTLSCMLRTVVFLYCIPNRSTFNCCLRESLRNRGSRFRNVRMIDQLLTVTRSDLIAEMSIGSGCLRKRSTNFPTLADSLLSSTRHTADCLCVCFWGNWNVDVRQGWHTPCLLLFAQPIFA